MKHLKLSFIICLSALFSAQVFAQTEKGRILLGGESKLQFSSTKEKYKDDNDEMDGGKTMNIEFSPNVGYFIINNLAVGASLPIAYESNKDGTDDKSSLTSIAIAPFARYYFAQGNIKPYIQGEIGFGSSIMKDEPATGDTNEIKFSLFTYGVGGGAGIFLNDNVSLDFGLEYGSISMKPKEDNPTNAKLIESGFGFQIGIIVLL